MITPLTTNATKAPTVPKNTCHTTMLTLSSEAGAISGSSDSKGPPESVLKRWSAISMMKK